MKFLLSLLISVLFSMGCYAQMKEVPGWILPAPYMQEHIKRAYLEHKELAFDLTNCLPTSFDKTGNTDYTKELQEGINAYRIVMMPNFPVLINDEGLSLNNNTILLFQPNSKLLLKPSSNEMYEIIRIHGVSNVKVYYANIVGDAKRHIGGAGEWGMGIAIRSSKNVRVYTPTIKNCWGDGIYVGTLTEKVNGRSRRVGPSQNIEIYNAYIDGNRRNGLSLVSVKGCKVYNSLFSNTRGTFPKSGIDIEPYRFAGDIEIINVVTFNNGQDGIVIAPYHIARSKAKDYQLNIVIDNHRDLQSRRGFRLSGFRDLDEEDGYSPINGHITISNSRWENNPYGSLDIRPNQSLGPEIEFIGNTAGQRKSDELKKGSEIKTLPFAKKGLEGKHRISFR